MENSFRNTTQMEHISHMDNTRSTDSRLVAYSRKRAVVAMRSSLFGMLTQPLLVVSYLLFGISYWSNLQEPKVPTSRVRQFLDP